MNAFCTLTDCQRAASFPEDSSLDGGNPSIGCFDDVKTGAPGHRCPRFWALRAFTLIELLVVIGVMAVLLVLLIPAFTSIGEASRLTSATQTVIAELSRARQEAISRNRAVEVRLYEVPPKDEPDNVTMTGVRAIRTIVLDETADFGPNARTGKLMYLPNGIRVSDNSTLTSSSWSRTGTESLPKVGDAKYIGFRFRPNGGAEFGSSNLVFWTLVGDRAGSALPANFSTIQLDVRTGRVRLFRP